MSFDTIPQHQRHWLVSIPLEQGNVFRLHSNYLNVVLKLVSIPLEQGNVFRHKFVQVVRSERTSFNPFGTGQCLSTIH